MDFVMVITIPDESFIGDRTEENAARMVRVAFDEAEAPFDARPVTNEDVL